jgi:predicted metal-dependent peptidase
MDAAQARVLRSRLQLMLGQPYLAAAIARLPLVRKQSGSWCDTFATDGYHIFYNEDFAATLADDELMFVLAHETLHCVLGHMDRRAERERLLWNVAVDYATNALLVTAGLAMPAGFLYEHAFRSITAEEIYRRLEAQPPEARARLTAGFGRNPPGNGGDFDLHIEPGDAEGEEHRRSGFPSREERRRMRVALAKELRGKIPGRVAGLFEEEITAATESRLPWPHLLARFVNGIRRSDYSLYPYNRKHIWRGLYLPSIGVPGPRHLVIAVDTSASMTSDDLAQILSEIDRVRTATECTLTVLESDAKVHRAVTFEPFETSRVGGTHRFAGRGGTDLRAPFHWIEERQRRGEIQPDALLFATDGFGPLPEQAAWPVLWIVPRHGRPSFPFGTVLRL